MAGLFSGWTRKCAGLAIMAASTIGFGLASPVQASPVVPARPDVVSYHTCADIARQPAHYFGTGLGSARELPGDKRVAADPWISVSVKGAPLSVHGDKVSVSFHAYPGTKARRFPKLTNASISIEESGAAHERPIPEQYRTFVPIPKNGQFSVSFKQLDRPTSFVAFVDLEFPAGHKPRYESAAVATCIQQHLTFPALRATHFLIGGHSTDWMGPFELAKNSFVLAGKPSKPNAGELYVHTSQGWDETDGNLANGLIADPPDVGTDGLHTFRMAGGTDGYIGHSNTVSAFVVPLNGKSASSDKNVDGDDKDLLSLELQIATNYCEGLGQLISEPASVSGLTSPEIEVLAKMEGDYTTSTCEGNQDALFDLFDNAGQYLSDYLAAKGKDAVAQKIVIPALGALLNQIDTDPTSFSGVLGHWLTDSGFDAVTDSISHCKNSVCSSVASGALSLYNSFSSAEGLL